MPTQLYFLISSFKYVIKVKTFVSDYHLNDPTTFLHHQIQVCSAHARKSPWNTKMLFRASRARARDFFNTEHKFKISKDNPMRL